jgi:hypothetical protein
MRKLFYLIIVAVSFGISASFISCSSFKRGPDAADIAANVAKKYYDYLLAGRYDLFVRGTLLPDTIPASYREQLETNAKMFIATQQDERKGIKSVEIADSKADTARHSANVFLIFNYGDKTKEQVLVPMTEYRGVWYMR